MKTTLDRFDVKALAGWTDTWAFAKNSAQESRLYDLSRGGYLERKEMVYNRRVRNDGTTIEIRNAYRRTDKGRAAVPS